jgi:hypothetical protein
VEGHVLHVLHLVLLTLLQAAVTNSPLSQGSQAAHTVSVVAPQGVAAYSDPPGQTVQVATIRLSSWPQARASYSVAPTGAQGKQVVLAVPPGHGTEESTYVSTGQAAQGAHTVSWVNVHGVTVHELEGQVVHEVQTLSWPWRYSLVLVQGSEMYSSARHAVQFEQVTSR